jgi:glycolate oxidase
MVGSEGTLGIICELTLKLIPAPKAAVSVMAPFEDLHTCVATVPKIFMNNYRPQAVEFFEREILVSSEEYIGRAVFPKEMGGKPIGAYLLLNFDGDSLDDLYVIVEKLSEFLIEEGALDILVADSPPKIKDIWAARSSFLEGIEEQTKLLDECDVVVPVSKIADYVRFVEDTGRKFDFEIKYFGHAGDGNLHIYTCSNDMELDEFKRQVGEFFKPVYDKAIELGGELTGEHGIGFGKTKYFEEIVGKTNIELQRGIKKVFDPKLILNPGKVCFHVDFVS